MPGSEGRNGGQWASAPEVFSYERNRRTVVAVMTLHPEWCLWFVFTARLFSWPNSSGSLLCIPQARAGILFHREEKLIVRKQWFPSLNVTVYESLSRLGQSARRSDFFLKPLGEGRLRSEELSVGTKLRHSPTLNPLNIFGALDSGKTSSLSKYRDWPVWSKGCNLLKENVYMDI